MSLWLRPTTVSQALCGDALKIFDKGKASKVVEFAVIVFEQVVTHRGRLCPSLRTSRW